MYKSPKKSYNITVGNNTPDESKLLDNFKELLVEYNKENGTDIPTEINIDLSDLQKKALEKFKNGDSLLILGAAGTGKSKLISEFVKYISTTNKNIYITATTGISSYSIQGITINSFMGIGTGEDTVDILLKRLRFKRPIKDRIYNTDILIIDEISMMSALLFEKINVIFQTIKKSKKPFGGIQLILTGDPLQLSPVPSSKSNDNRLIIESDLFKDIFNDSYIILKENFRQKNDTEFIEMLTRIRTCEHTEEDIIKINSKLLKPNEIIENSIVIVSSNKKAQEINERNMNNIKNEETVFNAVYDKFGDKNTTDMLENEFKTQFRQRGIDNLKLKVGCRVLLIKNLDVPRGLVNGSIGIVEEIGTESVRVSFDNGITEMIKKCEWTLEMNNSKVVSFQIPLMLAYSLTVHKCQSISLDTAVLDLADAFCYHQIYVALSRLKTFEGLYIKSFNPLKIKVDTRMIDFLNNLE